MGSWGSESFENDDALDWAAEFKEASDHLRFLECTFEKLENCEVADAELEAKGIAAAEAVAALFGSPNKDVDPEVIQIVKQFARSASLKRLALDAVTRIEQKSELRDLWAETNLNNWLSAIKDLRMRLSQVNLTSQP